ncbi:MAG: hypothetical protein IT375_23585 [Polyangiaceae bacterium]|nr:hypothetical protein [Polyangiaceae bacterium]
MIALVVSVLVAAGCIGVSAKRLALVTAIEREAVLSDGLERASRERLLSKLPAESALGRAAREVLEAPSRPLAVASLNETLGDVARELDVSREVPKSATRVALASGALLGLIELGRRLPDDGAQALVGAAPSVAAGLVGMVACMLLARSAEQRGRRARDGWDRLGRILERLLSESDNVGQHQRVDPGRPPD